MKFVHVLWVLNALLIAGTPVDAFDPITTTVVVSFGAALGRTIYNYLRETCDSRWLTYNSTGGRFWFNVFITSVSTAVSVVWFSSVYKISQIQQWNKKCSNSIVFLLLTAFLLMYYMCCLDFSKLNSCHNDESNGATKMSLFCFVFWNVSILGHVWGFAVTRAGFLLITQITRGQVGSVSHVS